MLRARVSVFLVAEVVFVLEVARFALPELCVFVKSCTAFQVTSALDVFVSGVGASVLVELGVETQRSCAREVILVCGSLLSCPSPRRRKAGPISARHRPSEPIGQADCQGAGGVVARRVPSKFLKFARSSTSMRSRSNDPNATLPRTPSQASRPAGGRFGRRLGQASPWKSRYGGCRAGTDSGRRRNSCMTALYYESHGAMRGMLPQDAH